MAGARALITEEVALQVPVPVRPGVGAVAVVVEGMSDAVVGEGLVEGLVRVLDHGFLDVVRTILRIGRTVEWTGDAVTRVEGKVAVPGQVGGQVDRIVLAEAGDIGGGDPEDRARGAIFDDRGPLDDLFDCRVQVIDGAGVAGGRGEEVGVLRGVAHGPEAAHRQSGIGASGFGRDGVEVGVDPGDELIDVERLPLGWATGTEIVPVGVPAALAGIGHHDDQRKAGGERSMLPKVVQSV